MRKILKIVLFPLVPAVRLYRNLKSRPSAKASRLFAYDRNRFVRYAGCFNGSSRAASLARVIMGYHVLEKGLTMPRRRLDFGHAAVLNLIGHIEDFEKNYGTDEPQVNHAVGCIKEYFELHVAAGFDQTKDISFWNQVKSFCVAHGSIASSRQVEMSREEFFANNEASFPAFAASRHTLRHYEGVVEIERIKNAVKLAMTAPSACNRQFVKVYCVSNHEMRDRLFRLQNGNRGFGSDADKVLVVTVDLCGSRWAEERNDLFTNAGIFIMNLCYSLHYNKIAHCILNWSVAPKDDMTARTILALPESETIVSIIACGNAPDCFLVASSPRKGLVDAFKEIK